MKPITASPQAGNPSADYLRDSPGGQTECVRCGTRALSRNPVLLATWERIHSQLCVARPHFQPVAPTAAAQ